MQFTEKQLRAIHTDGKSVLVSAAAGSGKTSVLAKRVARLVVDGCDIRNMLIMTFTNAAAAEMRQRISREIAACATEKKDVQMMQQAEFVSMADISTFHSFCGKVVRQNYATLGISPNFRITDQNEADRLRTEALRELFDDLYEAEDNGFLRLVERYTTRANDARLMEYVFDIYDYMMSKPDPFAWAEESLHKDEAYIRALKQEYERGMLNKLYEAEKMMELAADISSGFDAEQQKKDEACMALLSEMIACARQSGIADMAQRFAHSTLPACKRKLDAEHKEKIGQLYKMARANLRDVLKDPVYEKFESTAGEELKHTQEDICAFIGLVRAFSKAYAAQKEEKGVLDYEDLQHFALRALRDGSVRAFYAGQYLHVFVDEYQDTNPVQEEIIKAVSAGGSLFMVGDIKQSIYKFRLADPMIFKQKAQEFRAETTDSEIILMNDNFRSLSSVIDTVNYVMDKVMSERTGEIAYDESERLLGNMAGGHAEILLCETQDGEKDLRQAAMIADSIEKQMLRTVVDVRTKQPRPVRYGDIAVLLRSRSGFLSVFKDELNRRGIPCVVEMEAAQDLKEIELFVNLLRLIDNRRQDVPLLSVMRSYIGGFDEADFAEIRLIKNERGIPFYAAAREYAKQENGLGSRLRKFYEKLDKLQVYAQSLSLKELLKTVESEYDFATYVACTPGGALKRRVFASFMKLAAETAQSVGHSLYLLLQALKEIKKRDGAYVRTGVFAGDADCVRIMTIHGSKGLEFPIVYLAHMEAPLKPQELNKSILLHSDYGIVAKYVDGAKLLKRDTLETQMVKERLTQEYKSEELRILYVAMTRARDALFLTGSVRDYEKGCVAWDLMHTAGNYQNAKSMLDWVMAANAGEHKIKVSLATCGQEEAQGKKKVFDYPAFKEKLLLETQAEDLLSVRKQSDVPAKVSVSTVKQAQGSGLSMFLRPEAEETEEITGARLGTLIHSVMERTTQGQDVSFIAEDMFARKIVTQQEKEAIVKNREMAEAFLQTPLYERMLKAQRVLREQSFNLQAEAQSIGFEGKEKMLVQGILDLAFLEEGSWVLLDYKTDRVDEKTVEKVARGYALQLDLYARALTDITGIPVKQKYLYFMRIQKCIEV